MTKEEKQKPEAEIRLGRVKAVIWKNETERGERFNTSFLRIYRLPKEDRQNGDPSGGWRETTSFGRDDLLLLAKVADSVNTWIYQQSE